MNKMHKPDLGVTPDRENDLNDYVVDRLTLIEMLVCLIINLLQEVMDELKREGKFKFCLKNTINNIRRELKEILGNFFGKLDVEGTDQFVESYEVLENNVKVIAGLKSIDEVFVKEKKTLTQLFEEEWYATNTKPPMNSDIIAWTVENHRKYQDRYIK